MAKNIDWVRLLVNQLLILLQLTGDLSGDEGRLNQPRRNRTPQGLSQTASHTTAVYKSAYFKVLGVSQQKLCKERHMEQDLQRNNEIMTKSALAT